MKRYLIAVVLLAVSIVLSLWKTEEPVRQTVPVRVASRTIAAGEAVGASNTKQIEIDPSLLPEGADDWESEACVAAVTLSANTVVSAALVRRVDEDVPKEGYARTALRLSPEQALCWRLQLDEEIDVVFVDQEAKVHRLGKAIVKGYFDQRMEQDDNAVFLLIEAMESVVLQIVQHREQGAIEIVKTQ